MRIDVEDVKTWGECADRGKTSATNPPSPLPHNDMAGSPDGRWRGVCAWCGENAVNALAARAVCSAIRRI